MKIVRPLAAIVIAIPFMVPAPVSATGGYWSLGFGTRSKGMAGAGAAIGLDALSAGVNPASMALTPDRLDLGLALFFPDRGFTADEVPASQNCPPTGPNQPGCIPPGEYRSKNPLFMIPSFGWSKSLDAESTIGISIGGNGGMNTEYDSAVFRNYANPANPKTMPTGATGIDLSQMFIGGTYTRKTAEHQWVGVTPVIGIQNLKVKGLEPFTSMSESPDNVTGQGYDWSYGYGLRLGWLGEFSDQWSLGASYQTRIYMSKFEKYKGLLAEQGDFDIPPTLVVGLGYKTTPNVTLVLDYQKIWYSDVRSLSNTNLPSSPKFNLGGADGLGFGWKDQDIFKLGVQWKYSTDLTLRGGYAHASKVFDGSNAFFNLLAPATVQDHVTCGFSYRISEKDEISGSLMHAFSKRVPGSNPMFSGAQTGSVEMSQTELELSWGRRF